MCTKPGTLHKAQFKRICARRGAARAQTTVAHSLLTATWHILTSAKPYHEFGADYFIRQDPERTQRRVIAQLERLGYHVTVEPLAA